MGIRKNELQMMAGIGFVRTCQLEPEVLLALRQFVDFGFLLNAFSCFSEAFSNFRFFFVAPRIR